MRYAQYQQISSYIFSASLFAEQNTKAAKKTVDHYLNEARAVCGPSVLDKEDVKSEIEKMLARFGQECSNGRELASAL